MKLRLSNLAVVGIFPVVLSGCLENSSTDSNDNSGGSTPPTIVTINIGDGSITEGDSGSNDAVFRVSISAAASDEVTFEYATADGSATAGADYTAASGAMTIPAGSTSATITVSILGDTDVENLETFSVLLSNPSGNARLGDATAVMEIVDNDDESQPAPPPVGGAFPGVPEYSFRDQLPGLGDPADVTSCSENGTTVNGTPNDWVVVTLNQNSKCAISGSYYVVQNSTINDRLAPSGGPYAIRNNEIDSPGTGGALVPSGTDVLIEGNTIHNNGVIPSDPDHHGMNVRGNSERMWILSNSIYENSGDAIQFCHGCVGGVHDGPAYIYIAGNLMHDDEENAIDLKEFLGPVVAVCNEMYGYERGQFSGNGEAVRINDEGQQGEVWFAHNNYHDNLRDIAPYSSDAEGYFLDENTNNVNNSNSNSIIVNGAAAQQYYDQFEALYGLDLSAGCPAQ